MPGNTYEGSRLEWNKFSSTAKKTSQIQFAISTKYLSFCVADVSVNSGQSSPGTDLSISQAQSMRHMMTMGEPNVGVMSVGRQNVDPTMQVGAGN